VRLAVSSAEEWSGWRGRERYVQTPQCRASSRWQPGRGVRPNTRGNGLLTCCPKSRAKERCPLWARSCASSCRYLDMMRPFPFRCSSADFLNGEFSAATSELSPGHGRAKVSVRGIKIFMAPAGRRRRWRQETLEFRSVSSVRTERVGAVSPLPFGASLSERRG